MAVTTHIDEWNDDNPANADSAASGAAEIRFLKGAIAKRLEYEHATLAASGEGGRHLAGSARIFTGDYSGDPDTYLTDGPDDETLANTHDSGRLCFDTSDKKSYYWDGDSWEKLAQADVALSDGSTVTATINSDTPEELDSGLGRFCIGIILLTALSGSGYVSVYPKGGTAPTITGGSTDMKSASSAAISASYAHNFRIISESSSDGKFHVKRHYGAVEFTATLMATIG